MLLGLFLTCCLVGPGASHGFELPDGSSTRCGKKSKKSSKSSKSSSKSSKSSSKSSKSSSKSSKSSAPSKSVEPPPPKPVEPSKATQDAASIRGDADDDLEDAAVSTTGGAKPVAPPKIESREVVGLEPLAPEPLFATRELGDFTWTPDGRRLVVVTNLSGRPNLWAVDINGVGWPQQLTFTDEPVFHPRVSPDGKWVLYTADTARAGRSDLFIIPIGGGIPFNLTNTPQIDEQQAEWSPDGRMIAYCSDEDTSGSYQIYLRELVQGRPAGPARRVSRSIQSSVRPTWSPSGATLLVSRYRTPRDANLVLIDLRSSDETVLTPHQGEQQWLATAWSPEGTHVLATSDASGTNEVVVVELATRQALSITRSSGESVAWDWSPKEARLAWTTSNRGNIHILSGPPEVQPKNALLRLKKGSIDHARFSPDGKYLAFRYAGPLRAKDVWIYDVSRNIARQITFSMVSGVKVEHLVEPVSVSWPSFDGAVVSGFLYVPHNLAPGMRRPVVFWLHDGPDSSFVNTFEPGIQYLVSLGYLVLAPNYRGSTGHGRLFESLNDQDWGGGDLHDLVAATQYLRKIPYADPDRLVLMGRGYGAYLSLMGLLRTPDYWLAGVALGGAADLEKLYRSTSRERQSLMRLELQAPEANPILYRDRSPWNFLPNLRAPLLLVQGAGSSLMSQEEARLLLEKFKAQGSAVDFHYFEDEADDWVSRQTRVSLYRNIETFLGRTVGEAPKP